MLQPEMELAMFNSTMHSQILFMAQNPKYLHAWSIYTEKLFSEIVK